MNLEAALLGGLHTKKTEDSLFHRSEKRFMDSSNLNSGRSIIWYANIDLSDILAAIRRKAGRRCG